LEKSGGKLVRVDQALKLDEGLSLTGTMGVAIKEQSLILDTSRGLVIVAGCAHQGIVSILEKARQMTGRPIEAVLGGFHLLQTGDAEVGRIIARFKELGVARIGASHCTGDRAIAMFRDAYKDRFIELGAGRVLRFDK
jgi:7,8-dihydropterin-6-yl-methyl-4-(beta-D-ribofuranosyl)aminobenzene 5'-phosphate synthase